MSDTVELPVGDRTLLGALLGAQQEMPALKKTATNPHFKSRFAPLDTIVETVNPILHKHGLVWSTLPGHDEYGPALTYRLSHAGTGDSIEGTMPLLLSKQDPQGMGSAITYARRYALCAVLNLVADDDDDGAGASQSRSRAPAARPFEKQIRELVNEKGFKKPQLLTMLAAVGADDDPQIGQGWPTRLTAAQGAALIDLMKKGPIPEAGE
jgi:hypothetical protein